MEFIDPAAEPAASGGTAPQGGMRPASVRAAREALPAAREALPATCDALPAASDAPPAARDLPAAPPDALDLALAALDDSTAALAPGPRQMLALLLDALGTALAHSRSTGRPVAEVPAGGADEALAVLGVLDQLRSAVAALEATWQVEAEQRIRAADARDGIAPAQRGQGVAHEIALARRISPSASSFSLAAARRLVTSMPGTLAGLYEGAITERQAQVVGQRTDGAAPEVCERLDAQLAAEPGAFMGLGPRRTAAVITEMIHAIDPSDSRARVQRAAARRHVSMTPLADGMACVRAVLPALDAVSVMTALRQAAESERARGHRDHVRTIEADLLVSAVLDAAEATRAEELAAASTDQELVLEMDGDEEIIVSAPLTQSGGRAQSRIASRRRARRFDVGIVITDRALLQREDEAESAHLVGYGPLPAHVITSTLSGRPPGVSRTGEDEHADGEVSAVFRRLYTHPSTGELVAMESVGRAFPVGLKRMIRWRDATCRTPWCNAAVRHHDHALARSRGGATSFANGNGLCESCNLRKENGAWTLTSMDEPAGAVQSEDGSPETRTGFTWRSPHGAIGHSPTPRLEPRAGGTGDLRSHPLPPTRPVEPSPRVSDSPPSVPPPPRASSARFLPPPAHCPDEAPEDGPPRPPDDPDPASTLAA